MSRKGAGLQEVLRWSTERPDWQRDALRRLYESGGLSRDDEEELYDIARSVRSLGDSDGIVPAPRPLRPEHLPAPSVGGASVRLRAIYDVEQVNALAPGQRLEFQETGLTVLYGHNGSGKSGYARIMGKVCRTRGRDRPVLPNVFDRKRSGTPTATIAYLEGQAEREAAWMEGEPGPEALTQMSFFDSECAQAQVGAENELAYAPAAVHVLRQLAETCRRLKDRANGELASLKKARGSILADPPLRRGSTVSRALSSLDPTTTVQPLRKLSTLSPEEEKRLQEIRTALADDPERHAKAARIERERLKEVQSLGRRLVEGLSKERVERHFQLAEEAVRARKAASVAATEAFAEEPVQGVGSETWRRLWEAAREFSVTEAYPEVAFPNVEAGARCVLCHQELSRDAGDRLSRFETFVQERLETTAAAAERRVRQSETELAELRPNRRIVRQHLDDLRLVDEDLEPVVARFFVLGRWRLRGVVRHARAGSSDPLEQLPDLPAFPAERLGKHIDRLARRERELQAAARSDERQKLEQQLKDLEERQWLRQHLPAVEKEVERLADVERLECLVRDLDSTPVTKKSTEISEQVVTEELATAFAQELERLSVHTVKVQLKRALGRYGAPRYQIDLKDSALPSAKAAEVLSEGEYRAIALAGFLAELATSGDRSALIFDDPVSSLDHSWREKVAGRLAAEARDRQVVVFTHDLVFLYFLQEEAQRENVQLKHWRLVRRGELAGVLVEEPPGRTLKKRLGDLRNRLQHAAALKRREGDAAYEPAAGTSIVSCGKGGREVWKTFCSGAW